MVKFFFFWSLIYVAGQFFYLQVDSQFPLSPNSDTKKLRINLG